MAMRMSVTKLLAGACLILAFVSCSDDEVAPGETNDGVVTRISRDGVTDTELFYDIDRNLYRINYYFGGVLDTYTIYDYDEKGIGESRRYNADDHSPEYRTVFTLDNFGRIIEAENYSSPDFDNVVSISEFDYNTAGQLITREFRSAGEPVYYRREYTYDEGGNLVKMQHTVHPGQLNEYVGFEYEYIPGDRPIPDQWEMYVIILSVQSLDDRIRTMFNAGTTTRLWNSDKELYSESSYTASGHEFDSDGNLTRQIITTKNLLDPENPDTMWEVTYEYAR